MEIDGILFIDILDAIVASWDKEEDGECATKEQ